MSDFLRFFRRNGQVKAVSNSILFSGEESNAADVDVTYTI